MTTFPTSPADCSINRLTLNIIPNAILVINIEVPPLLTIGSVNPVTGTRLMETAMLANA